jgi:hypothetical protein
MLFERFAIEVLQMTQTVKGAMSILRLQWDATWHIIERAVARGKARKEPSLLPRIGIDEKALSKGQSYVTIVYNLDESTVEAIQEGYDVEAAKACLSQLNEQQIQSVQAIAPRRRSKVLLGQADAGRVLSLAFLRVPFPGICTITHTNPGWTMYSLIQPAVSFATIGKSIGKIVY